jgi:hypothetical protein
MEKVKQRITYANVVATIALFVALGGSAFAAKKLVLPKNSVTSKSVKDGSLKGKDLAKGTITGDLVAKNTLNADNINQATLVLPCPSGTTKAAGICFESSERATQGLDGAMTTCAQANRFLPTVAELRTLHVQSGVSVNGEQASDLGQDPNHSALGSDSGLSVSNDTGFARAFRCAVVPG